MATEAIKREFRGVYADQLADLYKPNAVPNQLAEQRAATDALKRRGA